MYNKRKVLENNIKAIEIALSGKNIVDDNIQILRDYRSFGGLKSVLLNPDIPELFPNSDKNLIPLVKELHEVLKNYTKDSQEYDEAVKTIRNSVLTSFYTPEEIILAINDAFSNIKFKNMLDPSAGIGAFLKLEADNKTCIEKDFLTGKILKALHGTDNEVLIQPFEKIPRSYEQQFDFVASNIPFGKIRIFDPIYLQGKDKIKIKSTETVHNYFFMKGLDMLQNGGVMAFITSIGVADSKENAFLRKALMKDAHLVSAIRLPANLFSESAGVEVQSDLIILQKEANRAQQLNKDEKKFVNGKLFELQVGKEIDKLLDNIGVILPSEFPEFPRKQRGEKQEQVENTYLLNQYLSNNIIANKFNTNQYGAAVYFFDGGMEVIANHLKKLLSDSINKNFDLKLFENRQFVIDTNKSPQTLQLSLFDDYSALIARNKPERRTEREDGEAKIRETEYKRYKELEDVYLKLKNAEFENRKEFPELRKQLNSVYDDFIKNFGLLSGLVNVKIREEAGFNEMLTLQKLVGQEYTKADIFLEPTAFGLKKIDYSIHDSLIASLNEFNNVDLGFMSSLCGEQEFIILEELKGQIYYNPLIDNYEISNKFLSGNVIDKLEKIMAVSVPENFMDEYNSSVEALTAVVPEPIPYEDIGIQLGERWIPERYYTEFSKAIFNPPGTLNDHKIRIDVYYNSDLDQFQCDPFRGNFYSEKRFGVKSNFRTYSAADVFEFALKDLTPNMTKKIMIDGVEVSIPDTEGIQRMNMAVEEIRNEFKQWLLKLPQQNKDELGTIYNSKFNCIVKPKYDGGYQVFPDLNLKNLGINDLYTSQKDAILLVKNAGGGMIDHEVGGGKTLILSVASYEMKRLGLANKPLILAMKANVNAIADTYKKAYPNAKVLYPTKEQLAKNNLDGFLSLIQNNNWDVIIMSHDQFKKIPQSFDIQEKIIKDEIRKLEEAIRRISFRDPEQERRAIKSLESTKKNLEVKLEQIFFKLNQNKSANSVNFQTMGIDHIFIDESHKFKNLSFSTKHNRVAGLGNPLGSEKSLNLLFAIRTIQERSGKDLGATFLSGTPISNSLTELYNIFNYLRPQAMKGQGLSSFDAWIATYAKKSKEFEFSVTNEIISKERFREFCKVPELATFYAEITDYKSAKMIGVDRPTKNEILVEIDQTPDQEYMFQNLREFARTGDGELIYREPLSDSEMKSKMLLATNVAKKASLDMRLVDSQFEDHPNNKINQCVNKVIEYYNRYNEQKGTQFIFSDLGVYNPKRGWDVYSELKRKFISAGIPESQVQLIQQHDTDRKKEQLIARMNAGDVRIVIGSTEKLGTGINAQERAVAVHHLDIPWTPKDFEQRNGRAVRAGNVVAKDFADNKVDVLIYAVKKTLDVYKFNLQATKLTFINQIKQQDINTRTYDEGSMDEKTGMNYNEYIAILSGDTKLLDKSRLEKKIAELNLQEKTFNDRNKNKDLFTNELKTKLDKSQGILSKLEKDFAKYQNMPKDSDGKVLFNIELKTPIIKDGSIEISQKDTCITNNKKQAGEVLNSLIEAEIKDTMNGVSIGNFNGFDIRIKPNLTMDGSYDNRLYVVGEISYQHHSGVLARTPELAGEYVLNALSKIEGLLEKQKDSHVSLQSDINDLNRLDCNVFPKHEELAELKKELIQLISEIEMVKHKDPNISLQQEGGMS